MPQAPKTLIEPGQYYHIYNRGVKKLSLFRDDQDYLRFLTLVKKYMEPVGEVLSFALMGNHYHLTVLMYPANQIDPKFRKTPQTLGRTFGHLQNAYAKYFNTRYDKMSGVFERSYERKRVLTLNYLRQLIVYHHLNPVKHGLELDFADYLWTSYQDLSSPLVESFLPKALVYDKFGGVEAFFAAHERPVPLALADEAEFIREDL